jgi:hypothetical protein
LTDATAQQIVDPRTSGLTWARVAATLNAMAVLTARAGRQWYPSTARNAALAYQRDMARPTPASV